MRAKIVSEGKALVRVYENKGRVSKELPVFYNPLMELNRTLSVLLLKSLGRKNLRIAEPLAGSGVRGVRFILELGKGVAESVHLNDVSPEAVKSIKGNVLLNKIRRIKVFNEDANIFLLNSKGFDYIDIDPFGSPVTFLDSAVKRLARGGILAVTATDTAALSGTSPKACLRKYWAAPKRDSMMHETGLRILIRRVQLVGASHSKALVPVFSYAKDHYMRVFFACEKSNEKCCWVLKQHLVVDGAGPLWTGPLWDAGLVEKMALLCGDEKTGKFLEAICGESKISVFGFYDIPALCREKKCGVPNFAELFEKIRAGGYCASRTHFDPMGVRSSIPREKLSALISG